MLRKMETNFYCLIILVSRKCRIFMNLKMDGAIISYFCPIDLTLIWSAVLNIIYLFLPNWILDFIFVSLTVIIIFQFLASKLLFESISILVCVFTVNLIAFTFYLDLVSFGDCVLRKFIFPLGY
jgi:hypothetical protein